MEGERWARGGGRGSSIRGGGRGFGSGRGAVRGGHRKFKFEDGLEEDFRIQVSRTLADFRASGEDCKEDWLAPVACTVFTPRLHS